MANTTVKFDIGELIQFTNLMVNKKNDFNNFVKKFLTDIGNRFLESVIPKTPKSPGGGNLRSRWNFKVLKEGMEAEVYIWNSADYADFVEYGHRGKYVPELGVTLFTDRFFTEGKFMMKMTAERIRFQMPLRLKEDFDKWIAENIE